MRAVVDGQACQHAWVLDEVLTDDPGIALVNRCAKCGAVELEPSASRDPRRTRD